MVEFGKLKEVMDWCRTNCSSGWHLHEVHDSIYAYDIPPIGKIANSYIFEFEHETDAVIFNLKWK